MALDATSPNLDLLLLGVVLRLELSERDLRVADKRYSHLEVHLARANSSLRHLMSSASVYAQGSRAIGATIVDGTSEDRFDLDALVEAPFPTSWTPQRVLEELEVSLQGFPDVREIERCTRCVQLRFAFMHLDVTPMRPASEPRPPRVGQIFHSPDDGADALCKSNPFGFADWVKANVARADFAFMSQARDLRKALNLPDRFVDTLPTYTAIARAETESLPDPVDPVRDSWQIIALKLMKRFLNLRYANRQEVRPISVYLTLPPECPRS